jgi:iron complex transport system permease protein
MSYGPRLPLRFGTRRFTALLAVLLLVAVAALLFSLSAGTVEIPLLRILGILVHGDDGLEGQVIRGLRLPRVLAGFLVGGMLAIAGALMQVLLRNPLAEPYVLGVSGGAALFALLCIAAGLGTGWIHLGAFGGALISIILVFALSHAGGEWSPMRVLLTGVVIAAGWGAAIGFLLTVSPAASVHGMLFWLMGDLGFAGYSHWYALLLAGGLLASLAISRGLNLLVHGDLEAAALGVHVPRLRCAVYFLASLLTAAAVMQAGSIGFVGLIIPHAVRLVFGTDHRVLLPVSMLLGGTLLVLADALARTIIAPQQLPVGILTALIGVPVFLVLLQTTARRQQP